MTGAERTRRCTACGQEQRDVVKVVAILPALSREHLEDMPTERCHLCGGRLETTIEEWAT